MVEFCWPPLPSGEVPSWDGDQLWVGSKSVPYAAYSENLVGWDDSLTSLHKREAADLHPIDVASRSYTLSALRRAHPGGPTAILEIGSSEGYMLRDLKAAYPHALLVGSEVAPAALKQIAIEQPGIPLLQFDILNCPLPPGSFDSLIALNVLEHIEDDVGALTNMARLLVQYGVLIVEVPSGPKLYDAYDSQLHHFRRYNMSEIRRKITAAGFKVMQRTHVGFFVYPGFAFVKKLNRARDRALKGTDVVTSAIRQTRGSRLLSIIFKAESTIFGVVPLPFGIRCFVVAQKL